MADALLDRLSEMWADLDPVDDWRPHIKDAIAEIERLRAEAEKLRTVMVAAAEEIAAHWQAHCDADGYGPVNLQRRLEEGIPSEYGYTAGAFAKLKAEKEALRAALAAQQAPQAEPVAHDCALKRGGVICRHCDLDTIARHTIAAPAAPAGWTDADADAARLALELECMLTDKGIPTATVSRWWDSAHEALRLHRERLAAPGAPQGDES